MLINIRGRGVPFDPPPCNCPPGDIRPIRIYNSIVGKPNTYFSLDGGLPMQDVSFNPDGTRMYIVGSSNPLFRQYDLSTPWDPQTATLSATYNENVYDANDIYWKPDGTQIFGAYGDAESTVIRWCLNTPWDISNGMTPIQSHGFPATDHQYVAAMTMSRDGTKVFIMDCTNPNSTSTSGAGRSISMYELSEPWELPSISSRIYKYSMDPIIPYQTFLGFPQPVGMEWQEDGNRYYFVTSAGNKVYEVPVSTPWDPRTSNGWGSVTNTLSSQQGLAFTGNNKMVTVGRTAPNNFQIFTL